MDDEDDDLDSFIDDSAEGSVNVSKAIRSMFGYDRRRYLDEEDDSSDMEVGYGAIAAEEARRYISSYLPQTDCGGIEFPVYISSYLPQTDCGGIEFRVVV